MKRYKCLVVLFLLCASLLTACGTGKSQSSNQGSGVDAGNSATSQGEAGTGNIVTSLPAGETDGVQGSNMTSCVETLYNPQSSSLALTDLAANTILASYPFDANQCVLSTEKVQNGVVALVTAQTEDDANSGNQSGVLIQSVDSDEKITVYRFDQQLNLRDSFRLDDSSLPDELVSSPLAVSRDGNTLTWVQEDGIYQYALETGDLKQVPLKLPETVYFVQIRYSEDGKSLFYFGDSGQEKVTAYGVLDVETGEGTLFHAKDFDASNITATGGYAVVNASVPPGASSGNGHVLFIDSIKKAGNEITLKISVSLLPHLFGGGFLKYVLPLPAGLLAGTGYLWGTLTEPRFNADFSEIKDVVVFRGVSPKEFLVLLVMFSIVLLLLLAFTVRRYVGRKLYCLTVKNSE